MTPGNLFMTQESLGKDLNRSEEVVFVSIALNPSTTGAEMVEELETSEKVFSYCVDTLLEKGYVDINEEGDDCWRVTDLGLLALKKFRNDMEFELIYARKKDEKKSVVDRIEEKLKRFDAACKMVQKRRKSK